MTLSFRFFFPLEYLSLHGFISKDSPYSFCGRFPSFLILQNQIPTYSFVFWKIAAWKISKGCQENNSDKFFIHWSWISERVMLLKSITLITSLRYKLFSSILVLKWTKIPAKSTIREIKINLPYQFFLKNLFKKI